MEVRRLQHEDREAWDPLWQGYLEFYEHALDDETTELSWRRLVGDDAEVVGLGAFDAERLVGICHLVFHPSTWSVSSYCYLEDLFVDPDDRGTGAGRVLPRPGPCRRSPRIEAARAHAEAAGSNKLYWQTHVDNETARHLYDRVAEHRGFIVYEGELSP